MRKECLPPVIDNDRIILILGTMPGERSIALQQYYGNNGNYFWRILYEVLGEPFSTKYSERLQLLQRHRIALWNTLASCEREGSSDNKIVNPEANDFREFYSRYPKIRSVFFESVAATRLYAKYAFKSPSVSYHTLPSTSGLNARYSYDEKVAEWRAIAKAIPAP